MSILIDAVTSYPGGLLVVSFQGGVTPVLTGPAADASNWGVTGSSTVTVRDVLVDGKVVVVLVSHPLEAAGLYSLSIPLGLADTLTDPYQGPFDVSFTAVGDGVAILQASSIDARTIQVLFDAKPTATALDPLSYTVSDGLTVASVSRVTDVVYLLTTSHQLMGGSYTIECPGVVADDATATASSTGTEQVYWGLSSETGPSLPVDLLSTMTARVSSSAANTISYGVSGGGTQYIYYAVPTSLGSINAAYDASTQLPFVFELVDAAYVSGDTTYRVYRSTFTTTESFVVRWA
jgi:hypothetical protein